MLAVDFPPSLAYTVSGTVSDGATCSVVASHHITKKKYKISSFYFVKSNDFFVWQETSQRGYEMKTKKTPPTKRENLKKEREETDNEDIMNFKNKELSCQGCFSNSKQ